MKNIYDYIKNIVFLLISTLLFSFFFIAILFIKFRILKWELMFRGVYKTGEAFVDKTPLDTIKRIKERKKFVYCK